jgi:hypothetical protein
LRSKMHCKGLRPLLQAGLILFCTLFFTGHITARETDYLRAAEDSLKVLSLSIIEPSDDPGRLDRNQQFLTYFETVLMQDPELNWPFDSLQAVAIQTAPDHSFRIITWYVPLSGSRFRYFGWVQVAANGQEGTRLFLLKDQTQTIQRPGFQALGPENWYGAWYYELIHNRHQGQDFYTLLGWKGDNPLTRKRVIEPFALGEDGPVFGAPVFDAGNPPRQRIIFEYSARVAMGLNYESHPPERGQRPQPMIVFDRLAPTHESLRGHFQHYMPEVNIFDAFIFEEGRWRFVRDVDARTTRR